MKLENAGPVGRALMTAAALFGILMMPVRSFAQLSVDELELRIHPEVTNARTSVFQVTNDTDKPIQAMLELQDWRRDATGANQFLPAGTTSGSCGQHIRIFPASLRVGAHATEPVRVSYDGDAARTCWAIVFVQANEPPKASSNNQSSITYVMRTGVKVYVEPENAARLGDVDSVLITHMNASATDSTQVPAIALLFHNTGQAHLKPSGAIEVRSADNQIAAKLTLEEFPIAPGDVRKLVLALPKLAPGRYVALALLDYAGSDIAAGQLEFEIPK